MDLKNGFALCVSLQNLFKSKTVSVNEKTKEILVEKPNKNILFIMRLKREGFKKRIKFTFKNIKQEPLPF
jgi:hypothetical protein